MKNKVEKFRILISRVAAILFFLVLLFTSSYWEGNNESISFMLFFFGIILVAVASLGRMWCSLYIAGYKNKELVTSGPYSISRNPLYLFSSIGLLGVGFATETVTIPLILILFFSIYYPGVIRSEEMRLSRLFGDDFVEYCRRVPAFIPKGLKIDEPDNYTVKPKVFRNHLFSALWFIWIVGVLEIIEGLREIGLLKIGILLP